MKKLFGMAVLCGLCVCTPAHAADIRADIRMDEVVVSANKMETAVSEVASSVSTVTEEELEARQNRNLVDVLQHMPGIFLTTQEGPAGMNGLSIRGADSTYTQLRYDGFPLREAADTNSGFSSFYSSLNLAPGSIGRIEVLKGSQGTLYGSSAMAGVVSIYSAKKWDSGFHASLDVAGGSWGTFRTAAQLSYGYDKCYVNFAPNFVTSDGHKGIWYDQGGFTLGAGLRLSEKTTVELSTLFSSYKNAAYDSQTLDASGKWVSQKALDDDRYHNKGNYLLTGLTLTHEVNDIWSVQGKAAFTNSDRESLGMWGDSEYLSHGSFFELINTVRPLDNLTLVAGAEYEAQSMELKENRVRVQDKSAGDFSGYAKGLLSFLDKKLNLSAGGRFNKHDDFSSHSTWELGLSYAFETDTRVFGRVATGYRTPSLYQRFGGGMYYVGNANLKPETSLGFEAGVEQSFWDNKVVFSATVFSTDYDDKLTGVCVDAERWLYAYENTDEAKVRGFELGMNLQPHEKVRIEAAYTHSSSKQKASGGDWVHGSQMPDDKISATLSVMPMEKMEVSLMARWEDRRLLNVYGVGFVEEDAFFTMDFAASYDITESLRIYARINNILDEDYTVRGWEMPGINAMAGVRYTF